MKIFKCVARTRDEAMSKAVKAHGENIQVVYEREFLYGIFNRKWIEIGYFVKGLGEDEAGSPHKFSGMAAAAFASNRISGILGENDFSEDVIEEAIGRFYSKVSTFGGMVSRADVESFACLEMERLAKQAVRPISLPSVLIAASPFEKARGAFFESMLALFSENEVQVGKGTVIADLSCELSCAGEHLKTVIVRSLGRLQEVKDELDGERLLVNVPKESFSDPRQMQEIQEIAGAPFSECLLLLIPGYVKYSVAVRLAEKWPPFAFAFTSLEKGDRIGNLISLCLRSGKGALIMDGADGAEKCDENAFISRLLHFEKGLKAKEGMR